MESYLQGQDLWEVVAGAETVPPPKESGESSSKKEGADPLRKWRIKAGKAMFVLKTTIEEDLLEHIRDAETPNEAWETLAKLFSKKNEARLQLLEKELAGISQGTLSINKYFTKVKNICREISQLDPEEKVSEARMRRIITNGLRPEYGGFMAAVSGWPVQPSLVELENLLANQEALAKQMGNFTLEEKDEEEALFIKKKGPPRGRGEAKEWTRGDRHCPKKSSYSGGAQQESDEEDDQEVVKNERRRRGECFNYGKKGHLARDCWSPLRHSEGNIATTKEVVLSTCPSEKEWDAEAATTIEDDEAYFVEDLIEGETPSSGVEEEEEWDADGGFSMEVRDLDTSSGFIISGCDSNEDWEALSDEEEDIKDDKVEPSLHEDEELQDHNKDEDGALVSYKDLKTRDEEKKLLEGCRCEDPKYDNASPAGILPSYKESSRGRTTRRVKKKEEMHGCIKSVGNLQLNTKVYALEEEKIIPRGQVKKKDRNGRAQKIQGQRHAMVRSSETSMH